MKVNVQVKVSFSAEVVAILVARVVLFCVKYEVLCREMWRILCTSLYWGRRIVDWGDGIRPHSHDSGLRATRPLLCLTACLRGSLLSVRVVWGIHAIVRVLCNVAQEGRFGRLKILPRRSFHEGLSICMALLSKVLRTILAVVSGPWQCVLWEVGEIVPTMMGGYSKGFVYWRGIVDRCLTSTEVGQTKVRFSATRSRRRRRHCLSTGKFGGWSRVRVWDSKVETVQPNETKPHKPEQKEPLDVIFELADHKPAFENDVLHISKDVFTPWDAKSCLMSIRRNATLYTQKYIFRFNFYTIKN